MDREQFGARADGSVCMNANRSHGARWAILLTDAAAGAAVAGGGWIDHLNAAGLIETYGDLTDRTAFDADAAVFVFRSHTQIVIQNGQAHADFQPVNQSQCTARAGFHARQFVADDARLTIGIDVRRAAKAFIERLK